MLPKPWPCPPCSAEGIHAELAECTWLMHAPPRRASRARLPSSTRGVWDSRRRPLVQPTQPNQRAACMCMTPNPPRAEHRSSAAHHAAIVAVIAGGHSRGPSSQVDDGHRITLVLSSDDEETTNAGQGEVCICCLTHIVRVEASSHRPHTHYHALNWDSEHAGRSRCRHQAPSPCCWSWRYR